MTMQALNASAHATDNKRHYWKCDMWIPTGMWIPLLGHLTHDASESDIHPGTSHQTGCSLNLVGHLEHAIWMMSEINLDTKIVQSEIVDVYPRLGIAEFETVVNIQVAVALFWMCWMCIQGQFLQSPATCHIIPHGRHVRQGNTFPAVVVNDSSVRCPINVSTQS